MDAYSLNYAYADAMAIIAESTKNTGHITFERLCHELVAKGYPIGTANAAVSRVIDSMLVKVDDDKLSMIKEV